MARRVLITPRSFGKANPRPLELLREKGYELVVNPHGRILTEREMMELVGDVDGIVIGVDPLNGAVLKRARQLKCISKYGVGTDNIDLAHAKAAGIAVSITAGANADAVADYTFALMLAVARRVALIDGRCRRGDWNKLSTQGVWGKTLGLIGLGVIGKGVARRAAGFHMKMLANDVVRDEAFAASIGLEYVSLERLLAESDFVSLHVPLLPQTRGMIGAAQLKAMKRSAVLINTARGGLVDEAALLRALQRGELYGAGIDVFEAEPPEDDGWYRLENVVLGSHCAASTVEAVENMGVMAARNLIDMLGD